MKQEQAERRVKLRKICDKLNPGGQSKLARLLKWDSSTIRRKLSGKTKITHSDDLAIQHVTECQESE